MNEEWIFDRSRRRDAAAHQRMADGNRYLRTERAELERGAIGSARGIESQTIQRRGHAA